MGGGGGLRAPPGVARTRALPGALVASCALVRVIVSGAFARAWRAPGGLGRRHGAGPRRLRGLQPRPQRLRRHAPHGAGTHSIEGKKWQENAEHIAQDIWGCSAFMLSKWDSYCRVDLGSPSQNFFRAPPARSAGKPMEHSYRYRLRFGGPIWLPKLPSIFPRDFKNFQAFFHRFFVR